MKGNYDYGLWAAVIFNIGLILLFVLSFVKPKGKREWRSMGTFTAFVVALFTEMYGFPLTIYLLTSALGARYPVLNPFAHGTGNLWAVLLGGSEILAGVLMVAGGGLTLAALIVLGAAWRRIHRANGQMVTSGLYARVRHPQYAGLFLLTAGFMVQWPTFITLLMWPVILFTYYRLARREERDMESQFGDIYKQYRQSVPMFVPRRR